ncbi:MAG: acyl-CoA dehydrogenase family protein, partial [Pseudomonadota bacterium]
MSDPAVLRAEARDYAKAHLGGDLAGREAAGDARGWQDEWRAAARGGLLDGFNRGLNVRDVTAQMEGLGEGCADAGLGLHICAQLFAVQEPIRHFGTEAQQAKYLTDMGSGAAIGAYALTEPDVGSEALGLQTLAEKDGDYYVLSGTKTYIGMAPVADVIVVFASTAPQHKHWGLSVFIVEGSDPGLTRGDAQDKVGLRTMPMGTLSFDECRIPANRLLGKEGAGQAIFQHTMLWERSLILASHVGAMARQLEQAVTFAKQRHVGGGPILRHQSVSNRLADMALRLETCRLMQAEAAVRIDMGT